MSYESSSRKTTLGDLKWSLPVDDGQLCHVKRRRIVEKKNMNI